MQVALSPEHEQLVDEKVRQGEYQSADEVVGTALRLLQEQDELLMLRRAEIERKIAAAEKSLKEGKGIECEEAFRQLKERHARYLAASNRP